MRQANVAQAGTGLVFAVSVFLGAFLLFQVQPLLGRFLLPWFGGTPEVWTACMLFFQVFLLAGYAYAHLLTQIRKVRLQPVVHSGMLLLALLMLPILPSDSLRPTADENPILKLLWICTLTVGLPYFMLSATSPLIQRWYSNTLKNRNPYRLYALSNAGSLLALASFPFVFEPLFTRVQTAHLWSISFVVFALLCSGSALLARGRSDSDTASNADISTASLEPTLSLKLLWLALPGCASLELLAVTDKITQDIPVIPFLWVLPLSLYLLSFIICFEHQRWYKRTVFIPLFILGIAGVIYAPVLEQQGTNIRLLIGLYMLMLFSCCMVCHGELYRLRPAARYLTGFYLLVAAGGALGGFFVAVLAPLIFTTYVELHLGLLACALFVGLAQQNLSPAQIKRRRFSAAALCAVGAVAILLIGRRGTESQRVIENSRNFFGVLTIWEEDRGQPSAHRLLMQHGTTYHGLQFQSPTKKHIPTAYYSPESGIGVVMNHLPKQAHRRIGIVGLGVGTIAIYGHETDVIRFYEINPDVERLARQYFTYLSDSEADIEVVLGDARLNMEAERPQQYDVLVLDAFSSDAVPVHLLTREAMQVYLRHLVPDGVLAFHISSWHLDLNSVVWDLADEFRLETAWIENSENEEQGALAADWILLATNDRFLASEAIRGIASRPPADHRDISLWTDDRVNLLEVLKGGLFNRPP